MSSRAAITIRRPLEEVQQAWGSRAHRPEYLEEGEAAVTFREAPGDRGTEIHVDLERSTPGGKLGEAVQKLLGTEPLATVKDDLRRFKQLVETGEIARSEAQPEGESLGGKLKERPAQPLSEAERQEVGV
jgi:hypothetical protein